jgi:hypothetical protein
MIFTFEITGTMGADGQIQWEGTATSRQRVWETTLAWCNDVMIDQQEDRARCRAERHAELQRLRGAVVRNLQVMWWQTIERFWRDPSQVMNMARMRYWSGHRDWTRGRHWDRRSRYGLN